MVFLDHGIPEGLTRCFQRIPPGDVAQPQRDLALDLRRDHDVRADRLGDRGDNLADVDARFGKRDSLHRYRSLRGTIDVWSSRHEAVDRDSHHVQVAAHLPHLRRETPDLFLVGNVTTQRDEEPPRGGRVKSGGVHPQTGRREPQLRDAEQHLLQVGRRGIRADELETVGPDPLFRDLLPGGRGLRLVASLRGQCIRAPTESHRGQDQGRATAAEHGVGSGTTGRKRTFAIQQHVHPPIELRLEAQDRECRGQWKGLRGLID